MQKKINRHYRMDEQTVILLNKNMEIINGNAADKKKISESEYIRDLIQRDYLEKVGISSEEFIKIRRILAGLGNNINQIAHHFNSGLYDMYDIDNLNNCIKDINEIKLKIADLVNGV